MHTKEHKHYSKIYSHCAQRVWILDVSEAIRDTHKLISGNYIREIVFVFAGIEHVLCWDLVIGWLSWAAGMHYINGLVQTTATVSIICLSKLKTDTHTYALSASLSSLLCALDTPPRAHATCGCSNWKQNVLLHTSNQMVYLITKLSTCEITLNLFALFCLSLFTERAREKERDTQTYIPFRLLEFSYWFSVV